MLLLGGQAVGHAACKVVDSFKASLLPNAIIMMAKGTTGVVRPRNNHKLLVSSPRMRG